jgi:protein lysine acetyltransferase
MSTSRHKPALSEPARPILRLVSTGPKQRAAALIRADVCAIVPALVNVFDIRAIQPADAELIVAAFSYTSSETYYRRFHAAKCCFSRRELEYLTQVDGMTHVALVAVERGDHPRLAADARFYKNPVNPREAELGICVYDPFRRRGLGAEMLRRLSAEASVRGVSQLRAIVQSDNAPMRALLYHVFPDTRVDDRCDGEVDYITPVRPGPVVSRQRRPKR